jgi:hypothetical protein
MGDYSLHLTFADGVVGDIDLRDELWGSVFEPLRDIELFKRFNLNTTTLGGQDESRRRRRMRLRWER